MRGARDHRGDTKSTYAHPRGEHDSRATNFCAWGAINRCARLHGLTPSEHERAYEVLRQAIKEKYSDLAATGNVPEFNDHEHTQLEDVVVAFDRAGELACKIATNAAQAA
jgi:hypothetical protein